MISSQWHKVKSIFIDIYSLSTTQKHDYLNQRCEDSAMCQEVLKLLQADKQTTSFITNAINHNVNELISSHSELNVGDSVDVFEIIMKLGHGGMGNVYLAKHFECGYDTNVAIKIPIKQLLGDCNNSNLQREANILSALNHKNIVKFIHKGSTKNGDPYLVMEHIKGDTIGDYCEFNHLSFHQCLSLFYQLCKTIEYLHEHYIVHQDIKSSNVLVDSNGVVKLVDFGIAEILPCHEFDFKKHAKNSYFVDFFENDKFLENCLNKNITTKNDLFLLGVLLYKILATLKAQQNSSGLTTCSNSIYLNVDSFRCNPFDHFFPMYNEAIDKILVMALQFNRCDSYSSVRQLSEEIARVLN